MRIIWLDPFSDGSSFYVACVYIHCHPTNQNRRLMMGLTIHFSCVSNTFSPQRIFFYDESGNDGSRSGSSGTCSFSLSSENSVDHISGIFPLVVSVEYFQLIESQNPLFVLVEYFPLVVSVENFLIIESQKLFVMSVEYFTLVVSVEYFQLVESENYFQLVESQNWFESQNYFPAQKHS